MELLSMEKIVCQYNFIQPIQAVTAPEILIFKVFVLQPQMKSKICYIFKQILVT